MRIGYLDCRSGISGDMMLGALVDAGASLERIQDAVDTLGVGDVRLTMANVKRRGMAAVSVKVHAPQGTPSVRTWQQIRGILEFVALDDTVRDHALSVFRRLAEAEASVHGVDIDDIHFHEIGALDTLADVVGSCQGIADLGLAQLHAGPISTGRGGIESLHGPLPLPGPAVSKLLTGFDVRGTDIDHELTTPTGAALIAEYAVPAPTLPSMRLAGVGVGAGGRELEAQPNVLRLLLGDVADDPTDDDGGDLYVLEATVDDLSPELVPVVLDHLRDAGAHDAWATPVLMKKGRPGYTLTAIAGAEELESLRGVLYRESSTIGTRWYPIEREALPREWLDVEVDGHTIRVKVARHRDEIVTAAPEADDVRRVAEATGTPARRVHEAAVLAANAQLGR